MTIFEWVYYISGDTPDGVNHVFKDVEYESYEEAFLAASELQEEADEGFAHKGCYVFYVHEKQR
ncbi:MAG: hypothetical protein ABIH76_08225 [Candidatus Bathyarchaeota archaeon]